MARTPQLLDARGQPVRRSELTKEIAAPTLTGTRSPISGYPGDGLDPARLAQILRAADHGEPLQYLELAETIEERDPHYLGVISTRKRSVSQIEITVEPASESAQDQKIAKMVEDWLRRDELTEEVFHVLDALGKGYSFTEIIWDRSMGQWWPLELKWRDPRWFRFDRINLRTPLMIDDDGSEIPLPAFRFIFAEMTAKSGLPVRSGIARVAMWGYLFKKFTERDWAIFTQTFGQPIRIGKFGPGASEADKKTLYRAVADIAGDMAGIMPEGMMVEIIQAANIGASHALYKERCDWLDQQTSKLVLGQTTSTDAISGGHAVSKEHREVQEDIERADARALQAILNRQLIQPFVQLNYGPQRAYPRLIIARPEQEDLETLSSVLTSLVPLGLRVSENEVRGKIGLAEPDENEPILGQITQNPPETPPETEASEQTSILKQQTAPLKYLLSQFDVSTRQSAQSRSTGRSAPLSEIDSLTDRLDEEAAPTIEAMLVQIEAMLEAAETPTQFREMLLNAFPELDSDGLVDKLADAISAAEAGGRALTEDEAGE